MILHRPPFLQISPSRRGFALLLVLILMVLALTMSVFFLASAGQERRGVDLYSRGSQARHLAGMAVNRVMGQIGEATREGTATAPVSWASQPGMVRTYDASGNPRSVYKLYSWDSAKEAGAGFDPTAANQLPASTWRADTAFYTDVNQPVNDVYPIVDPRAEGVVEGFKVDEGHQIVGSGASLAPMPVKWMYVLQDGQMVAPTGGSGKVATIPGASAANPIVGRVGYWTDDETSKVNINVASEGVYWDAPKSGSREDMQFAANPPAKGEFNRFPGHPASTSLSAVFPEFRAGTYSRWTNQSTYRTQLEHIANLLPKLGWGAGGSLGGTYPITNFNQDYNLPWGSEKIVLPMEQDADRLYVSADDMWFKASASPERSANDALAGLTPEDLRKRLFFLTAASRAPETTLAEKPRISMWPVTWPNKSSYYTTFGVQGTGRAKAPATSPSPTAALSSNPWMTASERLLAFCSTLNVVNGEGQRYFFQRQNPDSPTHDWANIQRNRDLVDFLDRELAAPIPGVGASLASKWGAKSANWVALNSFDFIRSRVNQFTLEGTDANPVAPSGTGGNAMGYSYTGTAFRETWVNGVNKILRVEPNAFAVSPLRVTRNGNTFTTLGAYPALEEVALMFYATERQEPQPPSDPALVNNPFNWTNLINAGPGNNGSSQYPVGSRTTKMRAVIMFDFNNTGGGITGYKPLFWVKVTRQGTFSVNGGSVPIPQNSSASAMIDMSSTYYGSISPAYSTLYTNDRSTPKVFSPTATGATGWPLISGDIAVDPTTISFFLNGPKLTVEVYAPYSNDVKTDPTNDAAQLVSTQEIDFGEWNNSTMPIPLAPRWNVRDSATRPSPDFSTNAANGEARDTRWAWTEIVPNIDFSYTDSIKDPRDNTSGAPAATSSSGRPIMYAYKDKSGLFSTKMENRMVALSRRDTKADAVEEPEGAAAGVKLFFSTTDAPMNEGTPIITPFDTVISMIRDPKDTTQGDPRLAHGGSAVFKASKDLGLGSPVELIRSAPSASARYYPRATSRAQHHQIGLPGDYPATTGYRKVAKLGSQDFARYGSSAGVANMGNDSTIDSYLGGEFNAELVLNPAWDWTTQPGRLRDGGVVARPDQDYQRLYSENSDKGAGTMTPYFQKFFLYGDGMSSYFSPNRQVPSPVILGTLPSSADVGWRTLAFSPNPAAGSAHLGLTSPADHYYLDYFWMPVAEPYPISDQFSTAGKINLNYRMMPFPHIERKTALHALMKNTWLTALPESAAPEYKSHAKMRAKTSVRTRYPINPAETLKSFDHRFDTTGDIFRSASQLCEMFLYPCQSTSDPSPLVNQSNNDATIKTWWASQTLTADNAREDPYSHLYSRVTTKSNTYTVHWRVQALQKTRLTAANTWDDARDIVRAELRGSSVIERFIDPNATTLPDYATDPSAAPLTHFYKWRIASETYFQP